MRKKVFRDEDRFIFKLFWPVLTEQTLTVLIGMVSVIMVSGVGDFAASGVNLVDSINNVVVFALNAFAIGATVVVANKIGAKKTEDAGETAVQSIVLCVVAATVIGAAVMAGGKPVLYLLYGNAEENVLEAASVYMWYSGLSYPFIGLFAACTGVIRAGGNTRTPMFASILANIVNVVVAYIFIRLGMGVKGVSLAMLGARVVSGGFAFFTLRKSVLGIVIPRYRIRLSSSVLNPVLTVGLPSGFDSLIFNGAKVILTVFISGMGTVVLHANAISNSLANFVLLPGSALSIISVTLVGQAYGARQLKKVRALMLRFCVICAASLGAMLVVTYLLIDPVISLYGPSAEAAEITRRVLLIYCILAPLVWGNAFCLPQMLRACGDAKITMYISICSMFALRVAGAWFFGVYLDWGLLGIWVGMFLDWFGRGVAFSIRSFTNAWYKDKDFADS